jgi:hypothetical protein
MFRKEEKMQMQKAEELFGKQVMTLKWDKDKNDFVDDMYCRFIAFGLQGEYSAMASLCYSSAIVIDKTNKLHNIPVENIRFIEEI